MIIEAGYDLHLLLFPDHSSSEGLRMVCLDANLRVTDVRTPIPAFAGVLDHSALDSIEAAIPDDDDLAPQLDTRFVGLGYRVTATSGTRGLRLGAREGCRREARASRDPTARHPGLR